MINLRAVLPALVDFAALHESDIDPLQTRMCSATSYPVAERPAYTHREIDPANRTQFDGDRKQYDQIGYPHPRNSLS